MSSPPPSSTRPHVLIVTADEDLRDFLQPTLIYGGFWVSAIASAIQVLEVFRLRTFDLALIDTALPGLDAVELLRRLRALPTDGTAVRADLPVLLIADEAEPTRDQAAVAAGATAILTPPLEASDLVTLLFTEVNAWRDAHPGRLWADAAAAAPDLARHDVPVSSPFDR